MIQGDDAVQIPVHPDAESNTILPPRIASERGTVGYLLNLINQDRTGPLYPLNLSDDTPPAQRSVVIGDRIFFPKHSFGITDENALKAIAWPPTGQAREVLEQISASIDAVEAEKGHRFGRQVAIGPAGSVVQVEPNSQLLIDESMLSDPDFTPEKLQKIVKHELKHAISGHLFLKHPFEQHVFVAGLMSDKPALMEKLKYSDNPEALVDALLLMQRETEDNMRFVINDGRIQPPFDNERKLSRQLDNPDVENMLLGLRTPSEAYDSAHMTVMDALMEPSRTVPHPDSQASYERLMREASSTNLEQAIALYNNVSKAMEYNADAFSLSPGDSPNTLEDGLRFVSKYADGGAAANHTDSPLETHPTIEERKVAATEHLAELQRNSVRNAAIERIKFFEQGLAERGIRVRMGAELEFVPLNAQGLPEANLLNEKALTRQLQQSIPTIERVHREPGSQAGYELVTGPNRHIRGTGLADASPLATAETVAAFKDSIQANASRWGLGGVSFDSVVQAAGITEKNSTHLNMSLWDEAGSQNLFYQAGGKTTDIERHVIDALIRTQAEGAAAYLPYADSYARLTPTYLDNLDSAALRNIASGTPNHAGHMINKAADLTYIIGLIKSMTTQGLRIDSVASRYAGGMFAKTAGVADRLQYGPNRSSMIGWEKPHQHRIESRLAAADVDPYVLVAMELGAAYEAVTEHVRPYQTGQSIDTLKEIIVDIGDKKFVVDIHNGKFDSVPLPRDIAAARNAMAGSERLQNLLGDDLYHGIIAYTDPTNHPDRVATKDNSDLLATMRSKLASGDYQVASLDEPVIERTISPDALPPKVAAAHEEAQAKYGAFDAAEEQQFIADARAKDARVERVFDTARQHAARQSTAQSPEMTPVAATIHAALDTAESPVRAPEERGFKTPWWGKAIAGIARVTGRTPPPPQNETLPTLASETTNRPQSPLREPSVWLLAAEYKGDTNNGLAVAKALSSNVRIVNGGLGGQGAFDPGEQKDTIVVHFQDAVEAGKWGETVHLSELPDVIISSGNNLMHQYIKGVNYHSQPDLFHIPVLKTPFVVHVVPPDYPADEYHHSATDMAVVLPHQIERPEQLHPNMRVFDTVPSPINAQTLEEGKRAWHDQLSGFTKARPVYFVVMGERLDAKGDLSIQDAHELGAHVAQAIKKTGGSVVLSTSPRTTNGKALIAAFSERLNPATPFYGYMFGSEGGNPYTGLLAHADKIIVTNDSMSMAGDSIATGKPTYVYTRLAEESDGSNVVPTRVEHDAHTRNMMEKKLILPIEQLALPAPETNLRPVNSAEQIANEIKARLETLGRLTRPVAGAAVMDRMPVGSEVPQAANRDAPSANGAKPAISAKDISDHLTYTADAKPYIRTDGLDASKQRLMIQLLEQFGFRNVRQEGGEAIHFDVDAYSEPYLKIFQKHASAPTVSAAAAGEVALPQQPLQLKDIHYPFGNTDPVVSVQLLLDAKSYVAGLEIPKDLGRKYRQQPHGNFAPVGNPETPAIMNSSYRANMTGDYFLSISMPDFTKLRGDVYVVRDPVTGAPLNDPNGGKKLAPADGLSSMNFTDAFTRMLEHHGINVARDEDGIAQVKIAPYKPEGSTYIEVRVSPEDYVKGVHLIDAYVRAAPSTTAHELSVTLRNPPAALWTPDAAEAALIRATAAEAPPRASDAARAVGVTTADEASPVTPAQKPAASSVALNRDPAALENVIKAIPNVETAQLIGVSEPYLPANHDGPLADSLRRVAAVYGNQSADYVLHKGPLSSLMFVTTPGASALLIPEVYAELPEALRDVAFAHEFDHHMRQSEMHESALRANDLQAHIDAFEKRYSSKIATVLGQERINDMRAHVASENQQYLWGTQQRELWADHNAAVYFGPDNVREWQNMLWFDFTKQNPHVLPLLFPELDEQSGNALDSDAIKKRISDIANGSHRLTSSNPEIQNFYDTMHERYDALNTLSVQQKLGLLKPYPYPAATALPTPTNAPEEKVPTIVDGVAPEPAALAEPKPSNEVLPDVLKPVRQSSSTKARLRSTTAMTAPIVVPDSIDSTGLPTRPIVTGQPALDFHIQGLPDAPAMPHMPTARGGMVYASAGSGTGLAMGAVFSWLRYQKGGSMDMARRVGGNQLAAEITASRADIAGMAPDAAFLTTAVLAKASKAASGLAPALEGLAVNGARVIGPVSLLAGAGVTYAEMQAAEAAQDGRREAAAVYGLLGGVAGGAGTGAVYGFAGGGPGGSLVAGVGGGIAGGLLASEYGRRSQMGDQMQRDLDHRAQLAVDASIDRLREIRSATAGGKPLSDTEKRDVRSIYVAMMEQHARLQVLYVPETDIDGQLRRDFQLNQAAKAMQFLKDPNARGIDLPRTSREAGIDASNRLPALVEQINARDGELHWNQWLDQDRFGKKDGIVTVAEVVKAANEYGLDLYTLDKDGKGMQLNELLGAMQAAGINSNGARNGRSSIPNTAPLIADSIHPAFRGRAGVGYLQAMLDDLHIPGLNGQQLRGVMDHYGISVAMLDLKAKGKITEGDVARAFLSNGVPREMLNGLADDVMALVPDARNKPTRWPTSNGHLEKLRDVIDQYSLSVGANHQQDKARWLAGREIALQYLADGGDRSDAKFRLQRVGVVIPSSEQFTAAGMMPLLDLNHDGALPLNEITAAMTGLHIKLSDANQNSRYDIDEIYAALSADQKAVVNRERARLQAIGTSVPSALLAHTLQAAEQPQAPIEEIVVAAPKLSLAEKAALARGVPAAVAKQLKEAGLFDAADADSDKTVTVRELRNLLRDAGITDAADKLKNPVAYQHGLPAELITQIQQENADHKR